jgi:Zn-finger nucleic acid-binding protein
MGGKPLGYNIKYVTREGYRTKKPYYEIKPGVWITRGELPEVIEYRKKNRHLKIKSMNKYMNTEHGYIRALFGSSRKNANYKNLSFKFTWEEWWQHWLDQKKKWGLICPYTRVTMTMIKGIKKKTITNVSADRINVKHGYTPVNTIFCTWDANNKKSAVSIDMCQAILDLYNESIEENFVNKYKIKRMGYKE